MTLNQLGQGIMSDCEQCASHVLVNVPLIIFCLAVQMKYHNGSSVSAHRHSLKLNSHDRPRCHGADKLTNKQTKAYLPKLT